MPGKLTTHALDTSRGCPARGLRIELHRLDDEGIRTPVRTTVTNSDGRTDAPLLGPEDMEVGAYELVFAVGAYHADLKTPVATPPFLDFIPIRFAIADRDASYHIPLLFSPWSYSTYRGS